MFRFALAVIAVLFLAVLASAQQPQVDPAVLKAWAAKVEDHEARITALEQASKPREGFGKKTYAEAYQEAVATGKPLVVWSGDAVCVACVHDTADEFVNYVGNVAGCTPNAITVGIPENGTINKATTITTWVTGDPVNGHVPSTRREIRRMRNVPVATPMMTTQPVFQQSMMYQQSFRSAPMMMNTAPVMRGGFFRGGMRAGNCASCG